MNDNQNDTQLQVEDSEGFVDREIKKNILKLRNNIDRALNEAKAHNLQHGNLSQAEIRQYVYQPVKSYLMRIEPLMNNFDTPGAEQVYLNEPLGTIEIYPPPVEVRPQAPGGLGFGDTELIAELQERYKGEKKVAKLARDADTPSPKRLEITGVRTLIEQQQAVASWRVKAVELHGERVGAPQMGEIVEISNAKSWPIDVQLKAVRATEQFLDGAGVGLALSEGDPKGVLS